MKVHRVTDYLDLSSTVRTALDNSFFSSRGFSDIWRTVGGSPMWWLVEEDGKQVSVFPGVEFGGRPVQRLQCMPDGCYARLLLLDEYKHQQKELGRLILDKISEFGYSKTYITDFTGKFDSSGKFDSISHTTNLCDISSGNWQPPDKKLQAQIRKAEREGVIVRRFNAASDMDGFMSLVEKTEGRHGRKPRYGRTFFKALANLSKTDERVTWYFCEHDNTPVASQINFVCDDMILSWQTFSDRQFSYLKANQFMLQTAIHEAAALGVAQFNPGLSPEDAEGLKTYKLRWGGVPYNYQTLVRRRGLGRLF